ncbi:hypothetical protein Ddc_08702 [Ditylenchus destructor]|nr:hypothetical protein Ddc_08702 [Ditylenchus destructor]
MASECPFATEKKTHHTTAKPTETLILPLQFPCQSALISRVVTLTVLLYYYFFMAIPVGNCIICGEYTDGWRGGTAESPKGDRCPQRELAGTPL